ncbi:hypothetical protein BJX99DRAFT_239745 [Aspergillus californicus]
MTITMAQRGPVQTPSVPSLLPVLERSTPPATAGPLRPPKNPTPRGHLPTHSGASRQHLADIQAPDDNHNCQGTANSSENKTNNKKGFFKTVRDRVRKHWKRNPGDEGSDREDDTNDGEEPTQGNEITVRSLFRTLKESWRTSNHSEKIKIIGMITRMFLHFKDTPFLSHRDAEVNRAFVEEGSGYGGCPLNPECMREKLNRRTQTPTGRDNGPLR